VTRLMPASLRSFIVLGAAPDATMNAWAGSVIPMSEARIERTGPTTVGIFE